MLQQRVAGGQLVQLVLREISDTDGFRRKALAAHQRQTLGDRFHKSCLALPVCADNRDPVIRVQTDIDIVQDARARPIAELRALDLEQRRRQFRFRRRKEERRRALGDRDRDILHLLEHLHAALGLTRLGRLGAEAVHEGLKVGALGGLLGALAFQLGKLGGAQAQPVIITTRRDRQLAVFQRQCVRDAAIEQLAVMADDQHRMRIFAQIAFQPGGAFQIEIVRRLVEQQEVRLREQRAGNRRAHAPAAGEFPRRAREVCMLEAKTHQHLGRAGFGRPGVDVQQAGMDLADPVRIRRRLGFGHQRMSLGIRLKHDLEDRLVRRRNLLRHPAEARPVLQPDRAVLAGRGDLLADQAQQCRFARSVAANHADLPAGRDPRRRRFKQRARFYAVVEIANFKHGRPITAQPRKDTLKALQSYIPAM